MKAVIFDMFETLVTLHGGPLYFGKEIAADLGVSAEEFYPFWHRTEDDRSKGALRFEEALTWIGEHMTFPYPERIAAVSEKRRAFKEEAFRHVESRILQMLQELKEHGAKIGLMSNCFWEEAEAIHNSSLVPYFDVMLLSCELGMQKPEPELYYRCMRELQAAPEECLYVGDGGSRELETAAKLGLHPLQAGWYLGTPGGSSRKEGIPFAEKPEEVVQAFRNCPGGCAVV